MKVLIADDSRSMRKMVQATLEEAGYEVVVAENGQQAWDALCKGDLRLAILDWVMPCMDGLEICRKLQKEKPLNMVQVILLTSTEGAENVAAALQAGASDYITKPFHPDELLARLKVGERIVNLQMQLSHAQKMEAIGSLASGIAHEINTPLQYVRDNVNFIQDAFRDMNKLLEKYSYLHNAAGHNQITPPCAPSSQGEDEGRGKILAGVGEVAGEEANVKYLMEEVPKAVKESLEGLGRITEIVKAMKEFAPPGAGIPEEIRPRIFDPFFTTKKIGRGTGMGLTTAHAVVVEKHGGTITFDTEIGKGTTFIIRLGVYSKQHEQLHVAVTSGLKPR